MERKRLGWDVDSFVRTPTRGTELTIDTAECSGKPCFILDLRRDALNRDDLQSWLNKFKVRVLNIAGPRESNGPGKLYNLASKALRELLV